MPRDGFQPEDLELINRVLDEFPKVKDLIRAVKHVSGVVKYPISSFNDLAKALGGDAAQLPLQERKLTVGELRKMIPVYYFPIGSEDDLVAKLGDLVEKQRKPHLPDADPPDIKWGEKLVKLPREAKKPVDHPLPESPKVPGVGGIHKP